MATEKPKTIREFLEMMDEPERSQAIENAKAYDEKQMDIIPGIQSIAWSLQTGFSWIKTPEGQGYGYWYLITKKYENR